MVYLERKQVSTTWPIIKLIIGILSSWFFVGIFLIISAVRDFQRIKDNNDLPKVTLEDGVAEGYVNVYDFERRKHVLRGDTIIAVTYDYRLKLNFLVYNQNGYERLICLGRIEDRDMIEFNKSLGL